MIEKADTRHDAIAHIARDLEYQDGIALQKRLLNELAANPDAPGAVVFAEHKPVITCGRSGDGSNLLVSPAELAANGISFFPSRRGGDVTYHGPGQWTVYPILRLDWFSRDLHRYLRLLEECVIVFLAGYDVLGTRRKGFTGVWVDGAKVAAIGIAVTRWITWHGFALNINPDLSRFTKFMHPCGIQADQGSVASLESITGQQHSLDGVLPALKQAMGHVLNLRIV